MADSSFQNEVPKARVNIQLDLHTGSARKKVELPLKLLAVGDFSNGKETLPLSERNKLNISKNNFNSVLSELNPEVSIDVANTLRGDGTEETIKLSFSEMKDFEPEAIAKQIPKLRTMLAMRNLLRDLKSNLLDNAEFRRSLETILKDPAIPAWQVAEKFPVLCQAGSPDDVREIYGAALKGIPLIPVSRVPAALPVRMENQYFALDMESPAAHEMQDQGVCMFYVPELLGALELELFAVLRS